MEQNEVLASIAKLNERINALGKLLVETNEKFKELDARKKYSLVTVQSQMLDQINLGLASAKLEWPVVGKDSVAHRNKYAKLEDVLMVTTPILAKHGLSVLQFIDTSEYGELSIRTRLCHKSGQWLESSIVLPEPIKGQTTQEQSWGITISYFKRYAYNALLGVIIDEVSDNDGHR